MYIRSWRDKLLNSLINNVFYFAWLLLGIRRAATLNERPAAIIWLRFLSTIATAAERNAHSIRRAYVTE